MITTDEVLLATSGEIISGNLKTGFQEIATDTRMPVKEELFVPLKGERFDGHNFIEEAISNGAAGILTSVADLPINIPKDMVVIRVKDTMQAFGDLGKYFRAKFSIPFIALTGSTGKTTTKEMLAQILSCKFNVLKSEANYNNEIGIPKTLMKLSPLHDVCILEFAMRGENQIDYLSDIAKPTIVIITNTGVSHLEKLKSREAIAKAKAEIFKSSENNFPQTAILNADDQYFQYFVDRTNHLERIVFGIKNQSNIFATDIVLSSRMVNFLVQTPNFEEEIELPLPGRHNVYNALAAISAAVSLGVEPEKIKEGLANFSPTMGRLNFFDCNGMRIIDDTYNANPDSTSAALEVLAVQENFLPAVKVRRIAVLGNMLELGDHSVSLHRSLGEKIVECDVDYLITVGDFAKHFALSAARSGLPQDCAFICQSNEEALERLKEIARPHDVILVKGSRAMQMEQVVEGLLQK